MKRLDLQILVKECANTRYKAIYLEIVSFATDILPSLIILKEPEAVAQMCSIKKMFLEISQNSQESRALPMPESESKNTFFIEHLWWLLLKNL